MKSVEQLQLMGLELGISWKLFHHMFQWHLSSLAPFEEFFIQLLTAWDSQFFVYFWLIPFLFVRSWNGKNLVNFLG